jgi:hypothetical protein
MSASVTASWQVPEIAARRGAAIKAGQASPDVRQRMSQSAHVRNSRPEYIQAQVDAQIARFKRETPKARDQRIANIRAGIARARARKAQEAKE